MHTLNRSYQGISLLVGLNWDRLLSLGILVGSLMLSGYIATM